MNVGKLRAFMRRYNEVGVLLVGAYMVGHHLWTRRRAALLAILTTLLVAVCWFRKGSDPASHPSVATSPPRVTSYADIQHQVYLPQRPLLLHASQVTALDEYYLTHFWISTDRLLLVTSAKPTRTYDCLDVFPNEWKGQATLLDLRTGLRRRLAGLTRVFQKMHAMPRYGVFDLWSSRLDGSDLKELGY
jgi:hypothetical protein